MREHCILHAVLFEKLPLFLVGPLDRLQTRAGLDVLAAVGDEQCIERTRRAVHESADFEDVEKFEHPCVNSQRGDVESLGYEGHVKLDTVEAAQRGCVVELFQECIFPGFDLLLVIRVNEIVRVLDAAVWIVDAGNGDAVLAWVKAFGFDVEAEHLLL